MYYVMRYDRELEGAAEADRLEVPEGTKLPSFSKGVRIEDEVPIFDLIIDPSGQGDLTDYLWTMLPMTVSTRFKKVLDSIGVDNIDYYPVRVVDEARGNIREDYYAANVVGVIACMDEANTEMSHMQPMIPGRPPKVLEIEKLAIDESKICGELLFRLDQVRVICLVHEKVKTAVEEAKLTGVTFLPANGYSWP